MINFEKLEVYRDSVEFAVSIYQLTKGFPKEELFGIIGQLRRASVSISLNIAEGSSRSKKEFRHFLDMARGSCYEIIPLLQVSVKLEYIGNKDYELFYEKTNSLARRINALRKSMNYEL